LAVLQQFCGFDPAEFAERSRSWKATRSTKKVKITTTYLPSHSRKQNVSFTFEREILRREMTSKTSDLLTELPLAAFIRYRKLLVPKMGRIDIHEKVSLLFY
jgi:hypothetical protein